MEKRPVKREAGQSAEEMAMQMMGQQAGNHLYESSSNRKGNYKEISDQLKTEALANVVDHQMQLMRQARERGRVDLDSLDEVTATAETYMKSCKMAGVFPTMLGFAAACGMSRMTLYRYIDAHPNSEVTQYLDALRSSWAAILAQMGLSRQASESVSIFLLKNTAQGLADRTELDIAAKPADPLGTMQDPKDIASKYNALPED